MPKANLLKQILETTQSVWDRPDTRPAIRKNFRAVINCGTPALGWEVYASDTEEKRCYHRCKSRFCPSCGYRATLLWLEQQEASLPDIPYAGIVFTMPRELWSVFGRNRHLLHDLPVVGASVIKQWIRSRYGANVLVVVVPHTFGGDLKFNSHLHILISAGGFQESSGRWIPFLRLEKDAIMRGWRHAVIDHLHRALKAGVLRSNLTAKDLSKILSVAYQHPRHPKWIIFLDRIASKSHFLRYAARYVRRPRLPGGACWRLRIERLCLWRKTLKRSGLSEPDAPSQNLFACWHRTYRTSTGTGFAISDYWHPEPKATTGQVCLWRWVKR